MKPYLAVIKDSFREAWASRVLWILLVLITLVLLAIIPFGWTRQLTIGLQQDDLRDYPKLATELKAALDQEPHSPAAYLASRFSDDLQQRLRTFTPPEPRLSPKDADLRRELVAAMDELLLRSDFFREDVWKDTTLNREARELLDRGVGSLATNEVQRLNRLALEAAFPQQIRSRSAQSFQFHYSFWDLGKPLRIRQDQLDQAIRGIVVAFISIVVGMIGVFSAILVTAPIIPNTLDSGSVSLLLSKPISRPLLFLAKFFGGCWYVLINGVYLIGGVWLLLGLRYGIWYRNLLLCIPIFLFLFIVYYSVSACAGLVWRNTVVCIVVTILFWFVCVLVGTAKSTIEMFFVYPNRVVKLLPVDGDLLAVNERGSVQQWMGDTNSWQSVFASNSPSPGPAIMMGPMAIGPVYDPVAQRLVSVTPAWPEAKLLLGRRADKWERVEVGSAPRDTRQLFVEADGRVLAVTGQGLQRLAADPEPKQPQLELFGFKVPLLGEQKLFQPAGPQPAQPLTDSTSLALNQTSGALYALQDNTLTSFARNEKGIYEQQGSAELAGESQRALLAAAGSSLLVARANGELLLLDAVSLQQKQQFVAERQGEPRFVVAAPDGSSIAVLFHNGRLWLIDTQHQALSSMTVAGQGDISAVAFDGPQRLLVADRIDRVAAYALPSGHVERRYMPVADTMRRVYQYVIRPIYTVFPKPSELDNSVSYLLTERNTVSFGPNQDDLSAARLKIDPWGPLWSSLAFVAFMLLVSCIYIRRQDF